MDLNCVDYITQSPSSISKSAISVISQLKFRADVDQACGKKNDSSSHHMSVINSTAHVFPDIREIESLP